MTTAIETKTLASIAIDNLRAELISVPDNGMFNSYDHVVLCRGCGTFHAVRSAFLGASLSIGFAFADGSQAVFPAHSCGKCPGEEIYQAWANGMRRSKLAHAAAQIGALPPRARRAAASS